MANKKIGIEVETRKTGNGFQRAENEAKELNDTMRRLERTLDTSSMDNYTRDLRRAEAEQRDFGQATEHVERLLEKQNQELRKTEQSTKELALATARGGREAFDYVQRYSRVITTLNQGRFHTVEMARALGILDQKTELSGQSMHQFGTRTEGATLDLRSLENSLETLTLTIKELTTNLDKSEKRMSESEIAVDALGTELQDTGDRAYYLNQALFESQTNLHIWETRAEAAEAKARALNAELRETGDEADEAGEELKRASTGADLFADELDDLKRSVQSVDGKLDKLDNAVDQIDGSMDKARFSTEAWAESFGNIFSNLLEEAAQAAWQFAQDATQAFYDFDRSSREIFTLIPEASGEMREALKADVLALGNELGRLPEEMLPAVYDALSAGIPADNVLSAIETASQAARAGVSDLDTTLKLGVAILNAQVGGVSNLEDVYDQLFFTVKNGVVTMPELTEGMNQVTSVAGEAGVSIQDISAALIVMTRQGDSAQEAFELLSIMLTQLSTGGTTLATVFEEAAGKSFRTFIAEGGNLAGAMELLQGHANNTGQALGDILGGGSPFFRDTQAARGALELTGKHLDDLVKFANDAEEATGSMTAASEEMGEAAELGALQGAAAWEEMKIAIGEANQAQSSFLNRSKTAIAGEVTAYAKQSIEIDKLTQAYDELGIEGVNLTTVIRAVTKTTQAGRPSWVEAEEMALRTEVAMRLLSEGFEGSTEELKELITHELRQTKAAKELGDSIADVDMKLIQMSSSFVVAQQAMPPSIEALHNASEAALELSNNLSTYGDDDIGTGLGQVALNAIEAKNAMIAANDDIARTTEDRANRIAAATAAEQAAILASRQAYNETAVAILHGAEVETNYKNALFETSAQMGISQGTFRELALASGEYSEQQIRTALTEAAMKQAVEELSGEIADGSITVDDAVEALGNFENALANDYTATLEFDDFVKAEEQAAETKAALLAAEGDYSASFTTTNTTINEVVTVTKGGDATKEEATASHEGGRFSAGELLMVGDGPGGRFVPGLTEFVMFDKAGTVIGADESARLFAGQGLPPGYGAKPTASDSLPGTAQGSSGGEKSPISINVYLYEAPNREITDSVLLALKQGGLVN